MLSFHSSIQKTQSSSGIWVERVLLTPPNIWRMNFQQPLLLYPLQKHFEGAEDVDSVPFGTFKGAISKN